MRATQLLILSLAYLAGMYGVLMMLITWFYDLNTTVSALAMIPFVWLLLTVSYRLTGTVIRRLNQLHTFKGSFIWIIPIISLSGIFITLFIIWPSLDLTRWTALAKVLTFLVTAGMIPARMIAGR
ncbi:hypothetical protein [Chitinophaga solisilvae]|uniref:hypothetical protein n=1 Tax=Chitinophaga solisilvae TaxID=1233460 RepID=UPI00136C9B9D|nr:hypothetical protein [Chitinophaga solisilvae]